MLSLSPKHNSKKRAQAAINHAAAMSKAEICHAHVSSIIFIQTFSVDTPRDNLDWQKKQCDECDTQMAGTCYGTQQRWAAHPCPGTFPLQSQTLCHSGPGWMGS